MKSFNEVIESTEKDYIKEVKIRKVSKCTFRMQGHNILVQFQHCGKEILPGSKVMDVWEYQYWGNSMRKSIKQRYCPDCVTKYKIRPIKEGYYVRKMMESW